MSSEGQPIDPFNLPEYDTNDPQLDPRLRELAERDPQYLRFNNFALRCRLIPSGERGSSKWVRELGSFWFQAREQLGLSRVQAAKRDEQTSILYKNIELGLLTNREFKNSGIFRDYAEALGDSSLYDVFQERFQLPIEPSVSGS